MRGERLLRWLKLIGPRDKLVRVKSWVPYICEGYLYWPVMLLDQPTHGYRATVVPRWDWIRLRNLFKKEST